MIQYRLAIILTGLCVFPNAVQALDLTEDGKWKLKSAIRLRYERDWNVAYASGIPRADRDRVRIAGTSELQYFPTKELSFGVRVGMASDNRNSNGNVTILDFQNNPKGNRNIYLDKWFVKFNDDNWWAWGGRNTLPFWVQNDYFWDVISTPAGVAFGASTKYQEHNLSLSLSHLATPDGKYRFNGQITSIQGIDTIKDEDFTAIAALGLFMFHKGNKASWTRSYNDNSSRDYKVLTANFQYIYPLWNMPLVFGADGYWNVQHYSANSPDKYAAAHRNEVLGWALSAKYGQNVNSGDWLLSYAYAYMQALVGNGDFVQSDWARFDPSGVDVKGHDIRLNYTVNKYIWISARTMLVERISNKENGNRFRLDFNFNF